MAWEVKKTYGHDLGLSCCFRQWKSGSHCSFLHGYALSFSFVFRRRGALDEKHWVIDYGNMKTIKQWLVDNYDHKTVVAEDDPEMHHLVEMHQKGIVNLRVVKSVSTEMFALEAGTFVKDWLAANHPSVELVNSEVREHGANSAIWRPSLEEGD